MHITRLIEIPVIETPANLSTKSMKRFSFAARFVRAMRGCLALAAVLLIASGRASAATPVTANYVATPTAVNTTAVQPSSMAVDGHGNIFYLDAKGSCPQGVSELAATNGVVNTSTTATCLFSSTLSGGVGIAVDTVGDVYVATGIYVYEIALDSNGKISSSSAVTTVVNADASGGYFLLSVAVDASGNLYMGALESGGYRVVEHKSGGSGLTTLATGFDDPISLALDAGGDVYVLDAGYHQVYKIPAGSSSVAVSSLTVLPVPSGVGGNLQTVSTDSSGDVFVMYQPGTAGNGVYEVVASGGVVTASSTVKIVAQGANNFYDAVAVSGDGRTLYVGETTASGSYAAGDGIFSASLQGVNLGAVLTGGGTPATATVLFQIDSSSSTNPFSKPLVLTQGLSSTNHGFYDLGTGSCGETGTYAPAAGTVCTVNVGFAPTTVGLVTGVVEMRDSSGDVLAKAWLSGTGTGPLVYVDPANTTKYTTATSGASFVAPQDVAVDAAGDLFVVDQGSTSYLYERSSSTGSWSTISSSLSYPNALAFDAAGNLYVNSNRTIVVIPDTSTTGGFTYTDASKSTLVPYTATFGGTELNLVQALAVSPDGILYISDGLACSTSRIVTYNLTTGATGVFATVATGLKSANGLAFDASGNLYVANSGFCNRSESGIVEYSAGVANPILVSTLGNPNSIVVEPSGSLLVLDTDKMAIFRIPNENGTLNPADAQTIENVPNPTGIAADANGNLYVGSNIPSSDAVYEFLRNAATLNFATTADGSTSAAQSLTLDNAGNQQISPLLSPITDHTDFTWSFCNNYTTKFMPSVGSACTISAEFTPQSPASGTLNSTLIFGGGTSGTTISPLWVTVNMSGTVELPPAAAPSFSPLPGTYAATQTVSLSDATANANIYYSTTGAATTSSTPYTTGTPITVSSSKTISAVATATGYSTSPASSASYIINPSAMAMTLGLTVSPAGSNTLTQTETLTATLNAESSYSVNGELVSFYDGANLLGTGTLNLIPPTGPGLAPPTCCAATLTTSAAANNLLSMGKHSLTAYYVGDANTLSTTSNAVPYVVGNSTSTTLSLNAYNTSVSGGSINTGTPLTLTANVNNIQAVGTVNFCIAGTSCTDINRVGSAQLNNGTASFTYIPGAGNYNYVAKYVGAPNAVVGGVVSPFLASISTAQTLTVNALLSSESTNTVLSTPAAGATQPFSLTATVTANGPGQISLNGSPVSLLNTSNGNASIASVNLAGDVQSLGFKDPNSTDPTVGIGGSGAANFVALGDLNGDGIQDMIVTSNLSMGPNVGSTVSRYSGNGDGTFTFINSNGSSIDQGFGKIVTGDFNGDGKLDFAVVTNTGVDVYLNNGSWSFTQHSYNLSNSFGSNFTSIAVGDFNGDGNLDLAVTHELSPSAVGILLGKGDGTFVVQSNQCTMATTNGTGGTTGAGCPVIGGESTDIEVGDFNEDGVLDLVVTDANNGKVDVFLGNGDGTFAASVPYSLAGSAPMGIAVGRFNGDSHLDLAVVSNNSILDILQGNGLGAFSPASYSPISLTGTPSGVAVGDFNGDGVADLAVSVNTAASNSVLVLPGSTSAGFSLTSLITAPLSASSQSFAVADLNGDGLSDFVALTYNETAAIGLAQYTQTATATFSNISTSTGLISGANVVEASYPQTGVYSGSTSNVVTLTASTLGSINFGTRPTTPLPAGESAGVVTVNVYQTNGAQDMTDTGIIQLVVTYPDKTTQTYSSPFSNGTTFFSTALFINLTELGTYSYTASVVGSPSITATATEIVYGPAVSLAVADYPTKVSAGFASYGEVGVLDANGNTALGFNGTVTVTTSESSVGIPVTITSGVGSFNTSFATVATNQSVTASYSGLTSTPQTGITVTAVPSFVVNTTADDSPTVATATANCPANPTTTGAGNCTLRDALAVAKNAGGNITFDPTVFATAKTIKLIGTGISPLPIAGSTIPPSTLYLPGYTSVTGPTTGSGANLTNLVTIDGNTTSTIFAAEANFYSTSILSNLNLQNGNGGPDPGGAGGINVTDSILNLNHCVFKSNQGADAGAIYSDESVLMIANSSFTGNQAFGGDGDGDGDAGAIYNDGESVLVGAVKAAPRSSTQERATLGLTVSNSTFTNNSGQFTGGILNYTNMTVTGSTFTGNKSTGDGDDDPDGGAILNFSGVSMDMVGPPVAPPANTPLAGSPYVGSSTFTNNSGLYGGAITNAGGDDSPALLVVAYSTFNGNTSASDGDGDPDAGALYNIGGYVEMSYNTFVGNRSSSQLGSGAIYNTDGGIAQAYGLTVSGNSGFYGGIDSDEYAESSNILNSIVSGNTTTDPTASTDSVDPNNNGFYFKSNQGNIIGTSAVNLAPLGNYGGPTQTMPPMPSSTAICAGAFKMLTTVYNNTGSTLTLDQRGLPNTNPNYPGYTTAAPCVDAGAVQTNYAISFTTQPPSSIGSGVAFTSSNAPKVTLTESGNPIAGASTLSVAGSPDPLSSSSVSLAAGVGSFSGLSITGTSTTSEQLSAKLILNTSLTPALSLTATSSSFSVTTILLPATTLNSGKVGVKYNGQITAATGGVGTVSYVATGLTDNLTLNSTTGAITGTPSSVATINFSVTAKDSNGNTASQSYTLSIASPSILLPATTLNPGGYGAAFNQSISPASGGVGPYSYALASGSLLPSGLLLNSSTGAITGTPSVSSATPYSFTIVATDTGSSGPGSPFTASQSYTLTINKATVNVVVNTASKTYGTANPTFSSTLSGILAADVANLSAIYSTTATVSSPVNGSTGYPITVSSLSGTAAANYALGTVTPGTLSITQASQTINFTQPISPVIFGSAPITLVATGGNSTSPVTFSATGPATVSGNALTITGVGTVVVTASQVADTNYTAATPVSYNITVNPVTPILNFVSVGGTTVTGSTVLNPVFGTAPFLVIASSVSPGAVTYSVASGPATVSGSTVTLTGAGWVTLNATQVATSNYIAANTSIRFQVAQATPQATVSSNPTALLSQNQVVLTATVGSAAATPTGSVTFLNGTTTLGTVALVNGSAQLTVSTLPVGTNSITTAYSGDANFVSVPSSTAASVTVVDFSIGAGSSGGAQVSAITAVPGASLTYSFTVSPSNGASTIPQSIILTLGGLPAGATYTFSPATINAGSGATNVTLTIQLPQNAVASQRQDGIGSKLGSPIAPFALALLLLPFAGRMRKAGRRIGRTLCVLLLLVGGMIAMVGITGCGSSKTGYFAQTPESYTVTINAVGGYLSHTSTFTLNVE